MSPPRIRPQGAGARPRPLGSGFRLRRDLSLVADAQRRFRAAAAQDEVINELQTDAAVPLPNPPSRCALRPAGPSPHSPPRSQGFVLAKRGAGEGNERAQAGREQAALEATRLEAANLGAAIFGAAVTGAAMFGTNEKADGNMDESNLTPLTLQARALYEGGVVQVRAVARLCGVSVRTLYNYVNQHGWRRRRATEARNPVRAQAQRMRRQALKAARPAAPRGLKARDPEGQARALAACEQAVAMSDVALARALARRDAEANARILAIMVRAMRDLAAIEGAASGEESPAAPLRKQDTDPSPQEIARRVKLLVDDQAGRASRPRPAPPPSLVDDEPLTEQDRRINAIAERFYARREGN